MKLIVNADDFGLTDGVTFGILSAMERGIVTSTTMMVNMPGTQTAAEIARKVPTIEVRITYRIPKLGAAAAGCHKVPKRISRMPTLNSAGVPLNIIYNVMEATARTAKKPHAVKIASAAFSTVDLLP